MDNLFNFLNTLFGIEITVFGIISAVVLVFVQLVYSNYSYKHIGQILKNKYLILFFAFSLIDLLLTSTGSYVLSLSNSNYFPELIFCATNIIKNPIYSIICLLLIFVSISFFVTLIVKNITYLQPHRAILLLAKNIHYEDIRNFVWKKYKLQPPYNLRNRVIIYDVDPDEGPEKTKEDREAERKNEEEDDDRTLKVIEKQIEKIKKRTAKSEDPLLSIRDMMIQFIRRDDLSSLTEAQGLLLSVSTNFIERVPKNTSTDWSPNNALLTNFTQYLIELLSTLLEIAQKDGLESAKKIILGVGLLYGDRLFDNSHFVEFEIIQKFFQQIADGSIGNSSKIFQEVIEFYQTTGEKTFDLLKEKPANEHNDERLSLLDNIFRSIGWLGERLLTKLPLEDSPIMSNDNYSTVYDTFLNCLLTFGYRYNREQPGLYPLIYFDSLYVVLKKLVLIFNKEKIKNLDEHIYSIAHTLASFANCAIMVGNADGACLAARNIKEAYDEIKRAGLDKDASDVIRLLVKIGIMAAGNKKLLTNATFMSESLHEWVADTLVSSGVNIEREVFDSYLHSHEVKSHDDAWEFITKLGVRMGTNFGFAFDPRTGIKYPENDPRRQ